MSADAPITHHTTADSSNRITLPKHFSDRIPWIKGIEPVHAWLWLLSSGRYRLLSDEQVTNHPQLEPIRCLIKDGKATMTAEATRAEEPGRAAMVARLLPSTITPPPPGWRISFPKGFEVFAPSDSDLKAFSIIFSLEGYWEIWYTDVLRRAATLPLNIQG